MIAESVKAMDIKCGDCFKFNGIVYKMLGYNNYTGKLDARSWTEDAEHIYLDFGTRVYPHERVKMWWEN